MHIGIDNEEVKEFICKGDTENPTVYIIKNLLHKDKTKLLGDAIDKTGAIDIQKLQERAQDVVRVGLKSIKNIYSKRLGKSVDIDVVDDYAVQLIPYSALIEIMAAIVQFNFLSETEVKNL
ncbi:MAG TPA: hypothetical protein PKL77_10090 [Candidatus Omnitrophota bacterium]|nr:hypothetical protein [Candidatus Omnitrophota bacterium]